MKKMFSTAEVAEMFNVSKATMYRLIESRKITFYKIGGTLRFTEEDVNRFLEESRINPIK